jgi:hypothetical protein
LQNGRGEQILPREGWYQWEEGTRWEECVCGSEYSVHMYVNGKMKPVETIPKMEGGTKENEWMG